MYNDLITALTNTGIPCAEGAWNNAPAAPYIVYALQGGGESLWGSDAQLQQAVIGTVDLFCADSKRGYMATVRDAIKASGVSFYLSSVQHETETRLVHYEWVFELEHAEPDPEPATTPDTQPDTPGSTDDGEDDTDAG